MANSARYFVLFMTSALWVAAAAAQETSFLEPNDDAPQEYALPLPGVDAPVQIDAPTADGVSAAEATAPFNPHGDLAFEDFGPDLGYIPGIAPIESTSSWLRRGFWYAEFDGVIWNRIWNRDDKLFAAEDIQVEQPSFFSEFNPAREFSTNRLMYLESSHPGQDGSVRATLGHFFFRDSSNRDHTAEFTALGGGDWEQERVITSRENFGLFVPFFIDGTALVGNGSTYEPGPFDQSTRQNIIYGSDYKSFELNYRVKARLGHDQLVMDPNGHWHRAADSGWEREYLAGLRFVNLGESLDWRAEDIQVGASTALGNDGRYQIETDNDMIGFQLGSGFTYQAPRWSLGTNFKGGVFANDATGQTILNLTNNTNQDDFSTFLREDQLSFVGEFRLQSRYHITPNFSVRAAYEVMYINAVALAPSQATFIPDFGFLNTTGDPLYHGASFGFEGYW